jgi:hypothetical protein
MFVVLFTAGGRQFHKRTAFGKNEWPKYSTVFYLNSDNLLWCNTTQALSEHILQGFNQIHPTSHPFILKAHFHSRKISTDRKFSENITVKSWKFSTSKIFLRRKICVGQSHFTKFSFCGKFSWVKMGLNKTIIAEPCNRVLIFGYMLWIFRNSCGIKDIQLPEKYKQN